MNTIWSFDLGKASIGEAVRNTQTNKFLHKASLLIPAEFASTKDARTRRRMYRTRQAHKAREAWLDAVWRAAGLVPLAGRRIEKRDGKWQSKLETPEQKKQRELLEREFPKKGDTTCYNSALLRIKLLDPRTLAPGEVLAEWQIYKALHSAIQKRGYGCVPWAAREARGGGRSEEEIVAKLLKKDVAKLSEEEKVYRVAVEAWPTFKEQVTDKAFHFPCYYDARAMGLWSPGAPTTLRERIDCTAGSTRRVRFDRDDVEKEIAVLANRAAELLSALGAAFARWKDEGCTVEWKETPTRPVLHFGKANPSKHAKAFDVKAEDFGDFLVHGPAGKLTEKAHEDFVGYLAFREEHGIHPGSTDDWMGATGQKTPRFDNRIINDCALIPRLQVCNVGVRFDRKTGKPVPDSLLASEVTFLMKLKNTLVEEPGRQRKLTLAEVRAIFKTVSEKAQAKSPELTARAAAVAKAFFLKTSDWGKTKGIKELALRPLKGHDEIKSPKVEGRSRFSRPALRLVRALILSGQKPSEFLARLRARDAALLDEIGMNVLDAEPVRFTGANGAEKKFIKQPRPWVLVSDLKFLEDLARKNDTWADLHFPEQRLDALEARHADASGAVNVPAAVRELLGSINDPVVRHRLGVFAKRLTAHEMQFGTPQEVVLEFVREDFMGDDAKRDLAKFQSQREKDRKEAAEQAARLGVAERSGRLKYELFKAQGGKCLYCQQPMLETELANLQIEHIVPRAQGGPDAMVNYVLAHGHCNAAKGDRTPFQWLHGHEGWDGYQRYVECHGTALRNKKVQLLLREDAPELVQRYTALAETAWISRLAQKIVSLHFGWRNGTDKDGVKRVTVVSGGLTARIRRKYRLNSLLAPCPAGEDPLEWEAKAEKNRKDDRHHALDAMVINFLPQWSRDAQKEHFFRFPGSIQENAQGFFRKEIDEVMARKLVLERPELEAKFYGKRANDSQEAERRGRSVSMVRRLEKVADLPYKSDNKKRTFDPSLQTALKRIENIRDSTLRTLFADYFDAYRPNEQEWNKKVEEGFYHPNGSRVRRLLLDRGRPEEYGNFSKDGTAAWRRGEPHRGQLIYIQTTKAKKGMAKEIIHVRPVYAFESRAVVEQRLREEFGDTVRIYGFFQSGCLIAIEREAAHKKKPLPPGTYLLNTIRTDNKDIKLTTQDGRTHPDIPRYSLANLIAAGLRRAD